MVLFLSTQVLGSIRQIGLIIAEYLGKVVGDVPFCRFSVVGFSDYGEVVICIERPFSRRFRSVMRV